MTNVFSEVRSVTGPNSLKIWIIYCHSYEYVGEYQNEADLHAGEGILNIGYSQIYSLFKNILTIRWNRSVSGTWVWGTGKPLLGYSYTLWA